jgi:hypothetical protein
MNFTYLTDSGSDHGGYTTTTLYDSNIVAGSPVYRLETKNLMTNGDMEGGQPPYISSGATAVFGAGSGTDSQLAARGGGGKWTTMAFTDATGYEYIDLPTALSSAYTSDKPYTLSLICRFDDGAGAHYLALDNPLLFSTGGGITQSNLILIDAAAVSQTYRFPFDTPTDSQSSVIIPSAANNTQTLVFNPSYATAAINTGLIPTSGIRQFQGVLDNLQLIRSDLDTAIRFNVPISYAGRPDLQQGGTYTVKLWIRKDLTGDSLLNAVHVNNRFNADFVSISINPSYTSATHGPTAVYARVTTSSSWTQYAFTGWDNWTQLTATFTGVYNSPVSGGTAFQIVIAPTNISSASLRSPGSILIANPQLYWSPN